MDTDDLMCHKMQIGFILFFIKEIIIRSSCCYNEVDFKEVMELMAKGLLSLLQHPTKRGQVFQPWLLTDKIFPKVRSRATRIW